MAARCYSPHVAHSLPLGAWPGLRILDLSCGSGRSGPSASRGGEATHLVFLRRGCFGYHLGARRWLGDPRTALLHHCAHEYRISHPADGGDDSTVIELDEALSDRLFGRSSATELPVTPRVQLALLRLRSALKRGEPLMDEPVLAFLDRLAPARMDGGASPRERRLATQVRERIHERLDENLGVGALAAELRLSPFTLMRTFQRVTGSTLRRYRLELRLSAALARIDRGEQDLARLAVDLGFSHHSHLTASFRRLYGAPPRRLVVSARF